jgi:hypothetical protein
MVPSNDIAAGNQFEERFRRLKQAVGAKTDTDLAKALDIKQSSVGSAIERKAIPARWVIEISDKYNVCSDWLLYGEGPKYRRERGAAGPEPPGVTPIDAAVQILQEAEAEASVELNQAQRLAVLKILRKALAEDRRDVIELIQSMQGGNKGEESD